MKGALGRCRAGLRCANAGDAPRGTHDNRAGHDSSNAYLIASDVFFMSRAARSSKSSLVTGRSFPWARPSAPPRHTANASEHGTPPQEAMVTVTLPSITSAADIPFAAQCWWAAQIARVPAPHLSQALVERAVRNVNHGTGTSSPSFSCTVNTRHLPLPDPAWQSARSPADMTFEALAWCRSPAAHLYLPHERTRLVELAPLFVREA